MSPDSSATDIAELKTLAVERHEAAVVHANENDDADSRLIQVCALAMQLLHAPCADIESIYLAMEGLCAIRFSSKLLADSNVEAAVDLRLQHPVERIRMYALRLKLYWKWIDSPLASENKENDPRVHHLQAIAVELQQTTWTNEFYILQLAELFSIIPCSGAEFVSCSQVEAAARRFKHHPSKTVRRMFRQLRVYWKWGAQLQSVEKTLESASTARGQPAEKLLTGTVWCGQARTLELMAKLSSHPVTPDQRQGVCKIIQLYQKHPSKVVRTMAHRLEKMVLRPGTGHLTSWETEGGW